MNRILAFVVLLAASPFASAACPALLDVKLPTLSEDGVSLCRYEGKVLLVVNTASQCGYTPQYKELEALHRRFKDKGLVVIGFPSNDFGGQEPGSNKEIANFCEVNYGVSFPMFAKLEVNGANAHPLYAWLTSQATSPEGSGPIKWNFGKFVIGPDGQVVARFAPTVAPEAPELVATIERTLS